MPEIKIFVDIKEDTTDRAIINQTNATKLGISSGDSLEILNPDNGKSAIAIAEVSDNALDFAGQISKNIIDKIEFNGIEIIVKPSTTTPSASQAPQPATPAQQTLQAPQAHLPGVGSQTTSTPRPTPTPQLTPMPQPTPAPQPAITPQPTP
ncbi:MAG: hypothetical protein EU540_08870, partial [Promethearchaeota archaeon]